MDGDYRHIAFGSILGDDRKPFKTRSGDTVSLQDVLDEAIERAARVVEEKSPDHAGGGKEARGGSGGHRRREVCGAFQQRCTDYVFNWDKMLALQGDTAPYLQNSYVRVRSIFRKLDGGPLDWSAPIQLSEDAEIHLARLLARYGEVVPLVLDDCRPNMLAAYLFDLARAFHSFYEACPVLKSEGTVRHSRLALVRADRPHAEARAGPAGHPAPGQDVTVSSVWPPLSSMSCWPPPWRGVLPPPRTGHTGTG